MNNRDNENNKNKKIKNRNRGFENDEDIVEGSASHKKKQKELQQWIDEQMQLENNKYQKDGETELD